MEFDTGLCEPCSRNINHHDAPTEAQVLLRILRDGFKIFTRSQSLRASVVHTDLPKRSGLTSSISEDSRSLI
jgi:hypothetical protein